MTAEHTLIVKLTDSGMSYADIEGLVDSSDGADSKSGTSSDSDVADGQTSFFENENPYDSEGNNLSATNRYGITVTMTYDKVGNLLSKTYPNGAKVEYAYPIGAQSEMPLPKLKSIR